MVALTNEPKKKVTEDWEWDGVIKCLFWKDAAEN